MIALARDADLDEGNIFVKLLEGWKHDVRNLWWVIDYNRQSPDVVGSDGLFLVSQAFRRLRSSRSIAALRLNMAVHDRAEWKPFAELEVPTERQAEPGAVTPTAARPSARALAICRETSPPRSAASAPLRQATLSRPGRPHLSLTHRNNEDPSRDAGLGPRSAESPGQRLPGLVWKIHLLHGAQTRLVQNAAITGDAPGTLSRPGTECIQGQCAALLKITQEIPVSLQAGHGGQRGEPGRSGPGILLRL